MNFPNPSWGWKRVNSKNKRSTPHNLAVAAPHRDWRLKYPTSREFQKLTIGAAERRWERV